MLKYQKKAYVSNHAETKKAVPDSPLNGLKYLDVVFLSLFAGNGSHSTTNNPDRLWTDELREEWERSLRSTR